MEKYLRRFFPIIKKKVRKCLKNHLLNTPTTYNLLLERIFDIKDPSKSSTRNNVHKLKKQNKIIKNSWNIFRK